MKFLSSRSLRFTGGDSNHTDKEVDNVRQVRVSAMKETGAGE